MPSCRRNFRSLRFALALIISCSACSATAFANCDDDDDEVELEVLAIRATMTDNNISPELTGLARKLRKQGFKFKGLKLEERETKSTDMGKAKIIDLPNDYVVGIRPVKRQGKRIRIHVKIAVEVKGKRKTKHDSELTMDCRAFQCWGGWELDNGDTFIIAVRAK